MTTYENDLMETHRKMNESKMITMEAVKNIIKHLQQDHVFSSPVKMTAEIYLNRSGQLLLQGYQHDVEIYLRGEKRHIFTVMKLKLDDYPEIMQSPHNIPDEYIDDLILGVLTDPYNVQCLIYTDNNKLILSFEIELPEAIKPDKYIKITRLDK